MAQGADHGFLDDVAGIEHGSDARRKPPAGPALQPRQVSSQQIVASLVVARLGHPQQFHRSLRIVWRGTIVMPLLKWARRRWCRGIAILPLIATTSQTS